MAQDKVTNIPDEIIETVRQDVKDISHGTVVIKIEDYVVVGTEVSKKRKFAKKIS